jgi:hypothetical protein
MTVGKNNQSTTFAAQCRLDPSLLVAAPPGITIQPGIGYTLISFCGGPNEPWHKVNYKKKGRKARKWKGSSTEEGEGEGEEVEEN